MKRILFIVFLFCAASCKKGEAVTIAPTITINTPISNQHFVTGDTIRISGTITSTIEMTEASVHMTDNATKDEFYHNHYIPSNPTNLPYDFKYKITSSSKTTFQVEVGAGDKNGGIATKEITISIN